MSAIFGPVSFFKTKKQQILTASVFFIKSSYLIKCITFSHFLKKDKQFSNIFCLGTKSIPHFYSFMPFNNTLEIANLKVGT